MKTLQLTKEEAQVLKDFIYAQGYISHEFHSGMYPLTKKVEAFLAGTEGLGENREVDSPSEQQPERERSQSSSTESVLPAPERKVPNY
jgi:hypothetical protein